MKLIKANVCVCVFINIYIDIHKYKEIKFTYKKKNVCTDTHM